MNAIVTYRRPGLLGNSVVNSFFESFFEDFPSHLKQTTQGYPVADIYSNEDGSTIMEFALAGFTKDEISVDVKPDKRSVVVSGDPAGQSGNPQRRIARRSFQKTYVNYDDNLDLAKTEATYQDGLLIVVIPKKEECKAISISIS